MESKSVLAGTLLGILLGALAVYLYVTYGGLAALPPSDHQEVINRLMVELKTINPDGTKGSQALQPRYQGSSQIIWSLVPYAEFTEGSEYKQTIWAFVAPDGDWEAVVSITGPDDTEKQYMVEASRLAGAELEVSYDGKVMATFPSETVWDVPQPGHVTFNVAIP